MYFGKLYLSNIQNIVSTFEGLTRLSRVNAVIIVCLKKTRQSDNYITKNFFNCDPTNLKQDII